LVGEEMDIHKAIKVVEDTVLFDTTEKVVQIAWERIKESVYNWENFKVAIETSDLKK